MRHTAQQEVQCPKTRPEFRGLHTRCKVIGIARDPENPTAIAANVWRVQLACDSELDIVLINCFTPSIYLLPEKPYDDPQINPLGNAAYKAACKLITEASPWLYLSIPTPVYDREWFPHLRPNSTQAGWLWLSQVRTLNAELILQGHASQIQPKGG